MVDPYVLGTAAVHVLRVSTMHTLVLLDSHFSRPTSILQNQERGHHMMRITCETFVSTVSTKLRKDAKSSSPVIRRNCASEQRSSSKLVPSSLFSPTFFALRTSSRRSQLRIDVSDMSCASADGAVDVRAGGLSFYDRLALLVGRPDLKFPGLTVKSAPKRKCARVNHKVGIVELVRTRGSKARRSWRPCEKWLLLR